jgi:predicted acyltransferase
VAISKDYFCLCRYFIVYAGMWTLCVVKDHVIICVIQEGSLRTIIAPIEVLLLKRRKKASATALS